ncbi:MAG: hypothetical protein CL910_02700 [Deltaproteobacteria bacterium]|jgi:hypothetical protein|nr:hypothetical protein [Deltaproteobacteria bacterium]
MAIHDFENAIEGLAEALRVAIAELRSGRESSPSLKLELKAAIHCLETFAEHGIPSRFAAICLPELETRSAASEYRVLEDHETENRESWTEVGVDGVLVRPIPDSLVIEPR